MGYPSYARNRACALPSPLPFHHLMAKNVPSVQWPRMLKVAPCTDGRMSKFSRLDVVLLFRIIVRLRYALCELRYNHLEILYKKQIILKLVFGLCLHVDSLANFPEIQLIACLPSEQTLRIDF